VEQGISDIVGCLTDPIIVFPGGWGDTIPEWLKTAITLERMIGDMKALKGEEEPIGTDAEACAYLMTVSLTQPMGSDWTQIYLYVASQTYKRWEKGEMPADIAICSIIDYQTGELNRLKAWIYRQRVKARLERDRAEWREEREETEAQRTAEQPGPVCVLGYYSGIDGIMLPDKKFANLHLTNQTWRYGMGPRYTVGNWKAILKGGRWGIWLIRR